MVGAPKTISDLSKLDANPVASCRRCIWVCEFDRAALERVRMQAGLSLAWEAFCNDTRCEACGGPVTIRMRMFVGDRALRKGDMKQALVFKALCVLEEALEDAARGRVRPSVGLRFALAYLYAVGQRSGEWFDREPYVEFWQLATQQDTPTRNGRTMEGSARGTKLQASMNAIARAAGMETTPAVIARLRAAIGAADGAAPPRPASNDD